MRRKKKLSNTKWLELNAEELDLLIRNVKFSLSVDGKHLLKLDPETSKIASEVIRERAEKNRALVKKLNELAL